MSARPPTCRVARRSPCRGRGPIRPAASSPIRTPPMRQVGGVPVRAARVPGLDSTSVPAADQLSPETCWTQTWTEHYQDSLGDAYPPYRLDQYATAADRRPDRRGSVATARTRASTTSRLRSSTGSLRGRRRHGLQRRQRGLCRRAARVRRRRRIGAAQQRDLRGHRRSTGRAVPSSTSSPPRRTPPGLLPDGGLFAGGRARSWAISCDPRRRSPPRSGADVARARRTGAFARAAEPQSGGAELSVSGSLWWSPSNWRNRIIGAVDVRAVPADACSVTTRAEQRRRRLRLRAHDPGDGTVGAELLPRQGAKLLLRPRPDG